MKERPTRTGEAVREYYKWLEDHRFEAIVVFVAAFWLAMALMNWIDGWSMLHANVDLGYVLASPAIVVALLAGWVACKGSSQRWLRSVGGLFVLVALYTLSLRETLYIFGGLIGAIFIIKVGLWLYAHRSPRKIHRTAFSHYTSSGAAKRAYPTLAQAQAVAVRQTEQTHEQMDAYQCSQCREYHVGHENPHH
jgi:hypothetical protein